METGRAAIKVAVVVRVLACIETSLFNIPIAITEIAAVIYVAVKRWPLPWFGPVAKFITLVACNCHALHLNLKF